jgi:hypothetical protein
MDDFYTNLDNIDPSTTLSGFDKTFNGGVLNPTPPIGFTKYTSGIPFNGQVMDESDAFITKLDLP